jgi:hypothetical protein
MRPTRTGPRNFTVINHAMSGTGTGFTITFTEHGKGHKFFAATEAEADAICAPIMARILAGTGFATTNHH